MPTKNPFLVSMKYPFIILLCSSLLGSASGSASSDGLEDRFKVPPPIAKPHTWWHWFAGHVSKEGITKDLEAMAAIGLGGFQVFDVSLDTPPGPVRYHSPEWYDLMQFAMEESERLGLEFGFHNCAGWSATGGPWITPENSMKQVVWNETKATFTEIAKEGGIDLHEPEHRKDFYRDIVVLAFPTPTVEEQGAEPYRLENWQQKGFHFPHARLTIHPSRLEWGTRTAPPQAVVALESVRMLKGDFAGERLRIDAQTLEGAENWTLLRFGYTTTGTMNSPAADEGQGLEIDKMNRAAMDIHWEHLIHRLLEQGAQHPGTFTNILIDSFEKNYQNWTEGLDTEFEERRGYPLIPWMVALTGRVIESTDQSERFLWDFRQTIGELINENYFRYFHEKANKHGLYAAIEPYGMGNFDEFGAALEGDMPMGEFWTRSDMPQQENSTTKLAASGANISGKRLVGAEAFTSVFDKTWTNHPRSLKPVADFHMAQGVNRMIFHTYVHQPWGDPITPGMNMGRFGFNFNRNNTWFSKSEPFIQYLTRTQFMIQEGRQRVDLLYVYGANTPADSHSREQMRPAVPRGFNYNKTGHQVLTRARVAPDGDILFPSGARFRVLIMTGAERMRLETATALLKLAEGGANILFDPPIATPGLTGFPQSDLQLKALVEQLYQHPNVRRTNELAALLADIDLQPDFDDGNGGDPPFYHGYNDDGAHWYFIANDEPHTQTLHATFRVGGMTPEIWDPETGTIRPAPIWAFTNDGRCRVQLDLYPEQSVFVVFRPGREEDEHSVIASVEFEPAEEDESPALNSAVRYEQVGSRTVAWASQTGRLTVTAADGRTESLKIDGPLYSRELGGPWEVRFGRFGPEEPVLFPELKAWNEHPDEAVRFFSGTATYRKTVDWKTHQREQPVYLDLGVVHEIAEVFVNGQSVATLWKPPFSVEVGQYLQSGQNAIEVRVTNLQVNRIIGDEQQSQSAVQWRQQTGHQITNGRVLTEIPEWVVENHENPIPGRHTFFTFRYWEKDAPLLESGLIGPVRLIIPQYIDISHDR
ncbi:MAG: hypothetical protein EA353_11585 [Puniceicoccaceae bacterium]|nr:MAG: hypothetical protein EA353_11585 [Puniceicoccaceae bacterium]